MLNDNQENNVEIYILKKNIKQQQRKNFSGFCVKLTIVDCISNIGCMLCRTTHTTLIANVLFNMTASHTFTLKLGLVDVSKSVFILPG